MLIYGVAKYTGKLTSERAREASLDFDIAGCNETRIAALARELGVPYRIFGVDDAAALRFGLNGVKRHAQLSQAALPGQPKP